MCRVETDRVEMSEIKLITNSFVSEGEARQEEDQLIDCFSTEISQLVTGYHKSLPGYEPTPLVSLREVFIGKNSLIDFLDSV